MNSNISQDILDALKEFRDARHSRDESVSRATCGTAGPVHHERADENSFMLAIVVLRDRLRCLAPEDRDDLFEMLPALLGDDDEAFISAWKVVRRVLEPPHVTAESTPLADDSLPPRM